MTRLVHILGPENVHLSIYETDSNYRSTTALMKFWEGVSCNNSIRTSELIPSQLPDVITASGKPQLKQTTFLADIRNRALEPIQDPTSSASRNRFDRILFLDNVNFDPVDAANLLFSTNVQATTGLPQYRAACAVDFIKSSQIPRHIRDQGHLRLCNGRTCLPLVLWRTRQRE